MWVLHYSLTGGIPFNNETMDVSVRQGNTQHRVNGSYICHQTIVPDNTLKWTDAYLFTDGTAVTH